MIRVMGAGQQAAAYPAEPTLVSTMAVQPAARAAPAGHAPAAQHKGKDTGERGSQSGPMLLTALAVMIAIALRRVGASA